MNKVCDTFKKGVFAGRARLWLLGGVLVFAPDARGAIVWSDPEPRLVCENGDGEDLLNGAVKPQDDTSSSTLYFKFTVDPLSDVTVDMDTPYQAGMVLYEQGVARLGVGNGLAAHAYSAFNATGQGLYWRPAGEGKGGGEFDFNAQVPGVTEGPFDRPRRGILRTILFRVQYVPGADDQVTVWFLPNLAPGQTEFSQRPEQVTRFKANASFDELHLYHRGSGEGWRFSDMVIATSFDDFVATHVWQRVWVVVPSLLALLGIIGGAVWLAERRRVRRQLQRLERERELDQERARIARDLHDELGVRLTEISLLATRHGPSGEAEQMCGSLDKIARVAFETAQTAEEIVWAVNPRNDNLTSFANYVVRFAENFLRSTAIRCRLDVPMDLPALLMSSDMRHSLLLAVKAAYNNAVCHSGADEILLRLSLEDATLRVSVDDNGRGFDVGAVPKGGNGLRNMRTRMAGVGGRVDIVSAPGRGTSVRFAVPLPQTGRPV